MKRFFHHRFFHIGIAVALIVAVILMALGVGRGKPKELVTATVENGPVRQLVSVSGITDAKQTAELAFPMSGFVESVSVGVGDEVSVGDVLLTLNTDALKADRAEAQATIAKAQSQLEELIEGPQSQERLVTSENLELKKQALRTTKENEASKVSAAYRALLSNGLTAYSNDARESAVAPEISGTYSCENEGTYTIQVFGSSAPSGYSYRISGLESGTFTASTEQPISFGSCGLRILFDKDSSYGNTTWFVDVPNTKTASYTTFKNAYDQAVVQANSAITLAEQEVLLAQATASNNNAPARSQAITQAQATIAQATARLARVESEIADRVLKAPFAGTVTEIDVTVGETVSSEPIITVLAENEFEMTARIPEIDTGKLAIGQKVEMVFDAKADEQLTGVISFISLKSTEIDGVSYYEAYIQMDSTPDWLRSGLNADINIILSETVDTLRIPKRFLIEENGTYSVLLTEGEAYATTTIEVTLQGNDGFVAITGLNSGDVIVAP